MLQWLKERVKSLPPMRQLVRERDELLFRASGLEHLLASYADGAACYDHDGMRLFGKNTDFLQSERFRRAYQVGMDSGHKIGRQMDSRDDIHIEWRVHIACWAASHALCLPGDFVECGVNTGILSLAICNFVDFNSTGKSFFLFDTYSGIPEEQMLESELVDRMKENGAMYEECYNITRMNIAAPEIAALEFFWDKLVGGAIVLLDDYGWLHHVEQKRAMDGFAQRKGVLIATLPTGQGLLIKPQ